MSGVKHTPCGAAEREARQDRLYDSAYAAGLKAGWNFAQEDDQEGLHRAIEQRVVGHKALIEEARAAIARARGEQDGGGHV